VKKLLFLVGLSMIGVLMFASEASATCVLSASGSASASGCNDLFLVSGSASVPPGLLSDKATASTPGMPATGGPSPALALVGLALMVGGGLLALGIVRRR
jgi:LPXTG-motif cell wall-anchored protein